MASRRINRDGVMFFIVNSYIYSVAIIGLLDFTYVSELQGVLNNDNIHIKQHRRQLSFCRATWASGRGSYSSRAGLHHLPFPFLDSAFSSSCGILDSGRRPPFQSIPTAVFSRRFSLEVVCGELPVVVVELFGGGSLSVAI